MRSARGGIVEADGDNIELGLWRLGEVEGGAAWAEEKRNWGGLRLFGVAG